MSNMAKRAMLVFQLRSNHGNFIEVYLDVLANSQVSRSLEMSTSVLLIRKNFSFKSDGRLPFSKT